LKIVFRADASEKMGSGHIIRCLTLAKVLHQNGATVTFISRKHKGNLNHLISKSGFQVIELSQPKSSYDEISKELGSGDDYESWLGVSDQQDAEETIDNIGLEKPDWLIVDHYSLGENWEKKLRPYIKKIMVIDDLVDRQHDCNFLLNQNYSKNNAKLYKGILPKSTTMFLGPKYAILGNEYVEARKKLRKRNGRFERFLVFFGASDPENLTSLSIEALSLPPLESVFLDVVIGVNHPNRNKIHTQCEMRGKAQSHTALPHLANLMAKADLCIGAGGSTTWERLCLGLPSIVVSTGENQVSTSLALGEDGYLEYLGEGSTLLTELLAQKISELASSPQKLARQSIDGQELVDGIGAQRICYNLLN
jgi:UDP-2,4-diacetamido-2,4,6-trideoxy-beta-L-altropyranose hydrolase